jgi:hypothetical protein
MYLQLLCKHFVIHTVDQLTDFHHLIVVNNKLVLFRHLNLLMLMLLEQQFDEDDHNFSRQSILNYHYQVHFVLVVHQIHIHKYHHLKQFHFFQFSK